MDVFFILQNFRSFWYNITKEMISYEKIHSYQQRQRSKTKQKKQEKMECVRRLMNEKTELQ